MLAVGLWKLKQGHTLQLYTGRTRRGRRISQHLVRIKNYTSRGIYTISVCVKSTLRSVTAHELPCSSFCSHESAIQKATHAAAVRPTSPPSPSSGFPDSWYWLYGQPFIRPINFLRLVLLV